MSVSKLIAAHEESVGGKKKKKSCYVRVAVNLQLLNVACEVMR